MNCFRFQTYALQGTSVKSEEVVLDENGFAFVSRCITALEDRGNVYLFYQVFICRWIF